MNKEGFLEALVIRHISDIEGAIRFAKDVVGPRLWDEAGTIIQNSVDNSSWHANSDPAETEVWFAHRSWLLKDSDPVASDFYIEIDEIKLMDGHGDNSWLASFTASGTDPSTTALVFRQSYLKPPAWKKLLKSATAATQALINKGFQHNVGTGDFFVPLVLDRELLARSFEDDDFEMAFRPLHEAISVCVSAYSELDLLTKLVRGHSPV